MTSPALPADVADIRARCEAGDLVRAMLGLGYVGDENAVSLGLLIENAFRAALQSALAEVAKHEQQIKAYIDLLVAQSDIEIDLRIKIDTLSERLRKCGTCGTPLSRDCATCQHNWGN